MDYVALSIKNRREVTLCNHNFSREGILHPDRQMTEYDLLYMQEGEWDVWEEENCYHLEPGSVLLLEPGKHHYSLEKCTPMMRNIYVHFSADELESTEAVESVIMLPKILQTADHKEIRHGFERIVDAFWSKDDAMKQFRCSLYLEELLLQLFDLGNASEKKSDVLISEIVHRFHCEIDRFLSPKELAEEYQMSVRSLSGRFKLVTGLSIHQYQQQIKLDMAYDMLPISPGRSLHDIALSYGFYDEFQFSKLFKRRFGISPSKRR